MPKTTKIEGLAPLQHARVWQKLADAEERRYNKDCERGEVFKTDTPASIRTSRNAAESYRMLHRTGKRHCGCHLVPLDECPPRVAYLRSIGKLKP